MDAESAHPGTMRSDRMLDEASKRITRIETVFPEGDPIFQPEPLDYADVIPSFSVMPSWDVAREFVGKEFVIDSNVFRVFAVEDLHEDVRIDGFTCELKVRLILPLLTRFTGMHNRRQQKNGNCQQCASCIFINKGASNA